MAGEVEASDLLLHGHQLLGGVLRNVRQMEGRQRCTLPLSPAEAKQVHLALHVPLAAGSDAVQHLAEHLHQLGAAAPHAVKGPRLNETLQHPPVQIVVKHAVTEVHKVCKGTMLDTLFQHGVHHIPAHSLQGSQAKADALG